MSEVARVAAQAKLNLWLSVGPRDGASGYHDIDTLFHRIDLADEVTVRVGGHVRAIDVDGPFVPAGGLGPSEVNLAYRAAVAYAEETSWPRGFAIEVTKHIPVGGGLGGGSADAGAVLRALDALAPKPLGSEALLGIAARLGSDVRFLTSRFVAAIGTGRGERLRAVDALEPRSVIVVVPKFAISTPEAYRWLDESRPNAGAAQAHAGARLDWNVVVTYSHNDFEDAVERRHPELRATRERLRDAGARVARVAGSGSSVFGIFDREIPSLSELGIDALKIVTRTSARVVQVEVGE